MASEVKANLFDGDICTQSKKIFLPGLPNRSIARTHTYTHTHEHSRSQRARILSITGQALDKSKEFTQVVSGNFEPI